MKSLPLAAAVLAVLMTGTSHAADTYKWTDDNGQVQYTQLPPKDRPYETIRVRSKEPAAAAAQTTPTNKAAGAENKQAKGDVAEAKAEAEKLARNCEIAKQNKEMLLTAAKIRVTDAEGNPRHLTEEERKARLADTEKQIEFYCDK